MAIKYELLLAKGYKVSAEEVRKGTLKDCPGVSWLFGRIDKATGPIVLAKVGM
jgi:hypothetical protein